MSRIAPFQLETLLAIARLGSFQAAADRLNTTQPAISARIRELEAQLGTKLFEREGRRRLLTPIGRQLVTESEPALAALDRVLIRATAGSSATGDIRIGSGEIASASCVPEYVRRIQTRFPHITIDLKVDLTARMLEDLLGRRTDLVFLAGPIEHPAIRTTSVGLLDLVWLAEPTVAEAWSKGLPQTIWTLPAHSPLHHIVRDTLVGDEDRYVAINTCNNVRALIAIVAQGSGIGLFPETMVRRELRSGALVEVLRRPAQRIEFQAAIRKREADPILLMLFEAAEHLDIDPDRLPRTVNEIAGS